MKRGKQKFITGNRIYLRDLTLLDTEGSYSNWLNDPEVCQFNSHARFPVSLSELKGYVRSNKSLNSRLVFAIVDKNTNQHVGNTSLQNIDYIDRSAELAIIIGEKKYWGKGIGLEAWNLVLEYGFKVLNLHRIYGGCADDNLGMKKIIEKSGMRLEGKRRKAFYKNGVYTDIFEYGILSEEYLKQ